MENGLFGFISKYLVLSEIEKKAIIDLDIFKNYSKGTILLKEGEISNQYYFVIKGCLRCYYFLDGHEVTTAFYTEAESFAPSCSKDGTPSPYYLSCVEESIIAIATPAIQKDMFEKFPRIEILCNLLSEEQLSKTQASYDEFKTSSPEKRYLNLLETRPDLLQRVPQHQIASYLGMKPESLSRIRKRLASKSK